MKIKRNDIELTAPAGSYESLIAAIQGGADSIYFGIEHLNMRARSSNNFTRKDIKEISNIARTNNLKVYLALNSVIYNNELNDIREIIGLVKKAGIDAIIASDQAVIRYAFDSGIEVHLSTQLNISNLESIKFYSQYADVVVLARELSLEQVAEIKKGIDEEKINGPSGRRIQIEMFVHGALCMAISGKCYMSLHEYNHSANRGDCFQVCRRSYVVRDKESDHELEIDNEFILSPKDLMTIHFLDRIIESGATVLKIEGRARSPEYVKTVTMCYNEALEAIVEGKYTKEKIQSWKKSLSTVYNRGFWDGYYLGQKLGEWSETYGSRATKKRVYIGKCTNYFSKIKIAEFIIESEELHVGNEIIISGPTTGVVEATISEIRVDLKNTDAVNKGEFCSIPINTLIRRSDKLYLLISSGSK